jgi:putative transposase
LRNGVSVPTENCVGVWIVGFTACRCKPPKRLLLNRGDRCDFFTVHTVWFEILFVFIVLTHDRRRVVHFNVTTHPTAEWAAQQIVEAFPFDSAPKYLLRDRDRIYGQKFQDHVAIMSIKEVLGAPWSPWQRAYVERVIGSIRRECLDHVIVFDEDSLRRTLRSYFSYYHRSRLHLSLNKDSPDSRPEVGGLHHRYERVA